MMGKKFIIAGRAIGPEEPPYVIAELSGNHNGDIQRIFNLIDAAKDAGADAVKLQTYTADTITLDHDGPGFTVSGGLWDGRRLYDLYREASTPWEWHAAIFEHAKEIDITCFSSPFDTSAVDFLQTFKVPAYKIASFEVIDTPLIAYTAKTGKPLIISTGLASPMEIEEAVMSARSGSDSANLIALLHCVSAYPALAADANLTRIAALAEQYNCPIGLSDHTLGIEVSVGAVALGACIIEKHLTLKRSDGGPDAAFSLEPNELKSLVNGVRNVHTAIGSGTPTRANSERENLVFRRSLYAVKDIAQGEALTEDNVRSIRPGHGLPPKYLPSLLGKHARILIKRGTPLSFDLFE